MELSDANNESLFDATVPFPAPLDTQRESLVASLNQFTHSICTLWPGPHSDTATFDVQITAIEQALEQAIGTFGFAVSSLRSHRNNQISINRFPIEILLKFFYHAVQYDDRAALRISHVCSYWRGMVLEERGLWANINTDNLTEAMAELHAQRSMNCPLTFSFDQAVHTEMSLNYYPYRLWQRYAQRVERLDLALYPEVRTWATNQLNYVTVQQWFSVGSLPLLHDLSLTMSASNFAFQEEDDIVPDLCFQMNNLHYLSLRGVRLPWAAGQYCGLIKLNIELPHGTVHPLDDSIFHIFMDSPFLENFSLYSRHELHLGAHSPVSDGTDRPQFAERPTRLQNTLKSVWLALCPSDLSFLLSEVVFPRTLSSLYLWTYEDNILPCIPRDPTHFQNLRDVYLCEISASHGGEITFKSADTVTTIQLGFDLDGSELSSVLQALWQLVRDLHSTNIITDIVLHGVLHSLVDFDIFKSVLRHALEIPELFALALREYNGFIDAAVLVNASLGDRHLAKLTIAKTELLANELLNLCVARRSQIEQLVVDNCLIICNTEDRAQTIFQDIRHIYEENVQFGSTTTRVDVYSTPFSVDLADIF